LSFAEKVRRVRKTEGIAGVARHALCKIRSILFEWNSAFWYERDVRKPCDEALIPGLQVTFDGTESTLNWIVNLGQEYMVHPDEVAVAQTERHLFGAARAHGEMVGYVKVGFGRVFVQDFGKAVRFPNDVAFIYDTFVLPSKRGQGIAGGMIRAAVQELQQRGFVGIRCHIPRWNRASMHAFEKCGFKRRKHIQYTRIFGVRLFSFNPEKL